MSKQNEFTRVLGLERPIVQAPMGGANATPPALVAAVSNAGGLGFIGAAYMSPAQIISAAAETRALTDRPFGINLFAPTPVPALPADADRAALALARYHDELGLAPAKLPELPAVAFDEQLDTALETGARVFSFTFGVLPAITIQGLAARGVYVIGTATTVDEAVALEASGVDAVVAQGSDAGGHRGTFLRPVAESLVGTMALVPQVVDAVKVPVLASGGIMDGRGIVAALALGASGVQMGTAFLTTSECGVAASYKAALTAAHDDETRVTRAFSGRAARGLVNRFMNEIELQNDDPPILPFPYQNVLTRALRNAANTADRSDFLSLWAGQGVRMVRQLPAAELMRRLDDEMREALRCL